MGLEFSVLRKEVTSESTAFLCYWYVLFAVYLYTEWLKPIVCMFVPKDHAAGSTDKGTGQ
jgi:hypothetical protein